VINVFRKQGCYHEEGVKQRRPRSVQQWTEVMKNHAAWQRQYTDEEAQPFGKEYLRP
jgi:hypothetical protein